MVCTTYAERCALKFNWPTAAFATLSLTLVMKSLTRVWYAVVIQGPTGSTIVQGGGSGPIKGPFLLSCLHSSTHVGMYEQLFWNMF